MKTATLYGITKKNVRAYSDTIPYVCQGPIVRSSNSQYHFQMDAVSEVKHLPIELWVLEGGERFFIAFEPDLRQIIQHKIHTEVHAVRTELSGLIKNLTAENERLQSRTLWDMIRSKFKRKQNDAH